MFCGCHREEHIEEKEGLVYCRNCHYLSEFETSLYCDYPENIYVVKNSNWFKGKHVGINHKARYPSEINKNNDCKWFKPATRWKMMFRGGWGS